MFCTFAGMISLKPGSKLCNLTHFSPVSHSIPPETKGFLTFSGGIEM